jgi:hypothetical protein
MGFEAKLANALNQVGVPNDKAEAVVDAINEELSKVAKNYVLEATAPIMVQLAEIKAILPTLATKADIAKIEGGIKATQISFGVVLAIIAAIAGVIKLLA